MMPHEVPTVRPDEIAPGAVLLDVREDDEWTAGHIEGALHVPMNSVPAQLQHDPGPLTPDAEIVVICKVGGRSAQVTAWLNRQGYRAANLEGGMLAWEHAAMPMVGVGDAPPFVA